MGVVYKAEDLDLKRIVALKFLSQHAVGHENVKARLTREAQAAASLDHPHICQVFGIQRRWRNLHRLVIRRWVLFSNRKMSLKEAGEGSCGQEGL